MEVASAVHQIANRKLKIENAAVADESVCSVAGAVGAALVRGFARVSDRADGPGERHGIFDGIAAGAAGDSLAAGAVSGTDRQRVGAAERTPGVEKHHAHNG